MGLKKIGPLISARIDSRAVKPEPKRADPELLTSQHREWRLIVCRRAGWRCEWIEAGQRCIKSTARGAAFDPANGQCLCVAHNTFKGIQARTARLAVPTKA